MMKIQSNHVLTFLALLTPACAYSANPNTVVATMNVGVTPTGIAITPSNNYAYVANSNAYTLTGEDTVTVLDLKNNIVKRTIIDPSFNQPSSVTINASGTRAYVTNSNDSTISVVNTATNTVTGVINGFDGPSSMVITPNGKKAYVANYGSTAGVGIGNGTTVQVVDLTTNTPMGSPITVGTAPKALAITPDGKFVYAVNYVDGNQETGTVSVIQTSNNTVVNTISGFSGPSAIAMAPDGKYAYVTNFGSNDLSQVGSTVSVINLKNNNIVATIDLGSIQPSSIAITPNGHLLYVTNYNTLATSENPMDLIPGEGTVNIIDVRTNKVISPTITVGQSPDAIAIARNGKFAYVANYTSNTVSAIALPSKKSAE